MTDALELDALWEDFHRAVNMTSQELAAWLRVGGADEDTGQHVLAILQKRRTDLTDDDIGVMYEVVDTVSAEADVESGAEPEETRRRRRLMTLGHDPLRP